MIKTFFSTLFFVFVSTQLLAGNDEPLTLGDDVNGQQLHDKLCTACHTTTVYTRPNRAIQTYGGLVGRVGGCSMQLKLDFSRQQINDVVAYLNKNFYKLDPDK